MWLVSDDTTGEKARCGGPGLVQLHMVMWSAVVWVSDSLCRYSLVVKTHSFISCPGGWSRMIPQVKKPNVEVLVVGVRPVRHTAKFSKMALEAANGGKISIQLSGNSSGGHSCSQHASRTLPQNLSHHCVV